MIPQVLRAITDAFGPAQIESGLKEDMGRVYGYVKVTGSDLFNDLDDLRRQQLLWTKMRETMGALTTRVGPVVLEPTSRELKRTTQELEPASRG